MVFSDPQTHFVSKELRLLRAVLGMTEEEAVETIERSGCLAFVEQRDREVFEPACPTGFSYRIRLIVKKDRVIKTDIG